MAGLFASDVKHAVIFASPWLLLNARQDINNMQQA